MGRGNFCPVGKLTDQWYLDLDECYPDEYDSLRIEYMEEDIQYFMTELAHHFPSLNWANKYLDHYWGQKVVLENKLFQIGVADNTWSYAIWIAERRDLDASMMGFAEKHFDEYRETIQKGLLEFFNVIYLRRGPWMSWKIEKDKEMEEEKNEV